MTTYDGAALAAAWLSVAVASGTDKDRPALHRTVAVEQFTSGVRLVATDSTILLHAWVSDVEHEHEPEPDLDEAPTTTAVVVDPHGRAKGFHGYVRQLTAESDGDAPEVRLELGVIVVEDDAEPTLAGLEPRWCVLDLPDTERVKLGLYEGEFPSWRTVVVGHKSVPTPLLALAPDMMARLAKVGKVLGDAPVGCRFGGENLAVAVEVPYIDPKVRGLVMPCRWDFDRNAPRDDAPADEGEQ